MGFRTYLISNNVRRKRVVMTRNKKNPVCRMFRWMFPIEHEHDEEQYKDIRAEINQLTNTVNRVEKNLDQTISILYTVSAKVEKLKLVMDELVKKQQS